MNQMQPLLWIWNTALPDIQLWIIQNLLNLNDDSTSSHREPVKNSTELFLTNVLICQCAELLNYHLKNLNHQKALLTQTVLVRVINAYVTSP